MAPADPPAAYAALAHALMRREIDESDLPDQVPSLPPLTMPLFRHLEREIGDTARHTPRLAWSLATVVESAASGEDSPRLQALAAFNVARAANAWLQPQRVWQAAQRARALFLQEGEPGWAAACDWQQVATPWATNDFEQAAQILQTALPALGAPEVAHLQLDCRLSLAFAHILLTQFDDAWSLLQRCERDCRAAGDNDRLAQTLSHQAACLRRTWRFDESVTAAREALQLLEPLAWPLEQARAQFQVGFTLHLQGADYEGAETMLQLALDAFTRAEVDLWSAQCHYALARVFRETGRLAPAGAALSEARRISRRYPIKGLLADTLLDSAVFALRTGQHEEALALLDETEPLYRQLRVDHLVPLCSLYRGETYAEMDRYQLALQDLERAYNRFHELQIEDRIAEAALRLGEAWLWLDQPATALAYLQEATAFYEETSHTSFLAELYSLLTAARLRNGDDLSQVIDSARAALRRLEPHGVQPYLALLQRFIGEAYLASGHPRHALHHLQAALDNFASMRMDVEVAECCLPLGRCYLALSQPHDAARAWQEALTLSQESLPAIAWRAHDGLAQLAVARGDERHALSHYAAMIAAFGRLRRGFWQPSLAGAYLHRSHQALQRAIDFAAARQAPQLLDFVEESKAQTLARRLRRYGAAPITRQQQALAAEIRWLQQQIGAARHARAPAGSWLRLQNELVASVQRYEALSTRSERQSVAIGGDPPSHQGFDLSAFRHAVSTTLGDQWVALDYYLTGRTLVCIWLASGERRVYTQSISAAMRRSLEVATRPIAGSPPQELSSLASWLLPAPLAEKLTSTTTLIISPHRRLHRLPWAAFPLRRADGAAAPLVDHCAPLLTPSLHTFTLLTSHEPPSDRRAGCVVAVSNFEGRRPPLPAVQREAALIEKSMGACGRLLAGAQGTWEALRYLSRPSGLAGYSFLHIASHAFFDAVTGRASGLALHDRDVWLDELWDLAPLPALVSLSACSGMQSYFHEGDEHIGLPATCLQAGARCVVGSLWPVRDEDAPLVTTAFYRHFFDGAHPALALARAQREAIAANAPWGAWAPFVCVGAG